MTMALNAADGTGMRAAILPRDGVTPAAATGADTPVADISRYRTIGSASALAAAIAASLVVTALLRLVL